MLAVILAGGVGTRLRPFTMTIPKPLLPLGDVPILDIILRQLAADGFHHVVLTLGHMAPLFVAHFGNGTRYGLGISYLLEDEPLGTAGPLRQLENPPDDFLVMNGDLLTNLSFATMVDEHRRRQAAATIGVAARQERVDYGVITTTPDGTLQDYREKPVIPYYVSMGINVLSARALRYIPSSGKFDMPDLMLALHRAGELVHCYRNNAYWQDMGRFDDYARASDDFVADPHQFLRHPEA